MNDLDKLSFSTLSKLANRGIKEATAIMVARQYSSNMTNRKSEKCQTIESSVTKMSDKELKDFEPQYNCRLHPTDYWHEVGCSHQEWTKDQLQDALNKTKQSNAYLFFLLTQKNETTDKVRK